MKKLIAMIGAVAMSFGLFAANYAISFEQAEDSQNMGVDTTSMQFTPPTEAGWTWEAEPFALSAYLTGDAFAYGSGAYARRNTAFKDQGLSANANYLPLSTGSDELTLAVGEGNIYLDQLVKFTGFEDPQTNLVAGTKIAVWMSEFENDDESTETNLYVTVGKVDANNVAEQVALKIDGTYSLDTWYRLSIKSLGDIYKGAEFTTPRAAFLVYVNGQQVTVAEEDMEVATALITNEGSMGGIAKGYMAKGQLFTSIAADATFTSVGYQGIGAVDDIILDDVGPAFCQAIDVQITFPVDDKGNPSVEVDYIDVGGVRMNYPCAVPAGTLITVYFKAVDGKKIMSTLQPQQLTVTANNFTIDVSDVVVEDVVAKKNGTVDVAESELYTVLDALVENDKVETISTCNVTNGEAVILYSFTPNTTITATAAGWDVFVGNYEMDNGEGGTIPSPGMLTVVSNITANFTMNVGVEGEAQSWVIFSGAAIDGQLAITNGLAMTQAAVTVGDGALLKAKNFTPGGFITLAGTGKFVTQTDPASEGMVGKIVDGKGNAVVPKANVPDAGWYTYALSDVPPAPTVDTVTFTVTYDDAQVENVTVTTNNGIAVELVGGVYTVESNAVVKVAATAKEGYQNVTITGDNVTVAAGVFKADKASSVITIAAEEIPPAPGFKIRLAGIDAADVEEGTDSITIKTEAQPLVYINGAAATVAGEAGAWTVTKPAISADTAISIVKGANIPAVGHKWYENATIVGSTAVVRTEGVTDGCAGWNGALDLAGNYIAAAYGYASQNLILTTVSDLVNAGDTAVDPITVVDASTNGGSLRGAAVSAALGVMITGNANSGAIRVYSLDGLTTNLVTTSNGVVPDAFAFDADGQTLWANGYSPSSARNAIYKYTIKDNLIGDGEKLELAATYEVGERVRGMKKFGDVIIAKTESHWYVMNLADDTPTFAQMTFDDYNYFDDVEIAGEHFYHLDAADGPGGVIKVYNLNAAGTWFEGDPIKTISITGDIGCSRCSNSGISFFVTADEETMIFTDRRDDQCENIVRAIQWTLPTYDITFATVENGTLETSVTNGIAAGTTVTVIVTPATGYECTEITTNGTAITGTSFEMPVGDVEIGATFTLQPVDPETPKSYDSKEAADAAADAINANKTAMIKTPDGADAADYTALFTAVVKANNEVVVELNEGGTNALKSAATTIETAVAGKLDDIAAATAGNSVSVTVTVGVKNGFWYGVAATADLTRMDSTQPTEWVQAKNDSVTIKATKPETGNAAFFQTRVKVK